MVVCVFDLDGPIFDTFRIYCDECNHTLQHFGLPSKTDAEYRTILLGTAEEVIKSLGLDTDDKRKALLGRVRGRLAQGAPDILAETPFDLYKI